MHQISEYLFLHKIQLKKIFTKTGIKPSKNSTAGHEVSWNNCALETLYYKVIWTRKTSIINFLRGPVIDILKQ